MLSPESVEYPDFIAFYSHFAQVYTCREMEIHTQCLIHLDCGLIMSGTVSLYVYTMPSTMGSQEEPLGAIVNQRMSNFNNPSGIGSQGISSLLTLPVTLHLLFLVFCCGFWGWHQLRWPYWLEQVLRIPAALLQRKGLPESQEDDLPWQGAPHPTLCAEQGEWRGVRWAKGVEDLDVPAVWPFSGAAHRSAILLSSAAGFFVHKQNIKGIENLRKKSSKAHLCCSFLEAPVRQRLAEFFV